MNFLTKVFFLVSEFKLVLGATKVLFNDLVDLKGFFFSTEKDFLPEVAMDDVSIFFFKSDEIVSIFFYLFP